MAPSAESSVPASSHPSPADEVLEGPDRSGGTAQGLIALAAILIIILLV